MVSTLQGGFHRRLPARLRYPAYEHVRARTASSIFDPEGSTPRNAAAPPSMTVSPSTRTLNSP